MPHIALSPRAIAQEIVEKNRSIRLVLVRPSAGRCSYARALGVAAHT